MLGFDIVVKLWGSDEPNYCCGLTALGASIEFVTWFFYINNPSIVSKNISNSILRALKCGKSILSKLRFWNC